MSKLERPPFGFDWGCAKIEELENEQPICERNKSEEEQE